MRRNGYWSLPGHQKRRKKFSFKVSDKIINWVIFCIFYVLYSTLLHLCRPSDSTVSEDARINSQHNKTYLFILTIHFAEHVKAKPYPKKRPGSLLSEKNWRIQDDKIMQYWTFLAHLMLWRNTVLYPCAKPSFIWNR